MPAAKQTTQATGNGGTNKEMAHVRPSTLFHAADELARRLRRESTDATQASWEMDHAMWRIAAAETYDETTAAIEHLKSMVEKHV